MPIPEPVLRPEPAPAMSFATVPGQPEGPKTQPASSLIPTPPQHMEDEAESAVPVSMPTNWVDSFTALPASERDKLMARLLASGTPRP